VCEQHEAVVFNPFPAATFVEDRLARIVRISAAPGTGRQASRGVAFLVSQIPPERQRPAVYQNRALSAVRDVRSARVHLEPATQLYERAVNVNDRLYA